MPIMIGDTSMQNTDLDHTDLPSRDASEFYPELKKMLRQLCYKHLYFDDCVEIVGIICVEIDHKSKDNHSIKEVVRRGLTPRERTHERRQSDLEASEAELVTLAMSRVAKTDGGHVSFGGHDGMVADGPASTSEGAGTTHFNSNTVSGHDPAVSASLHHGQRPVQDGGDSRTNWDGGGEDCEAAASVPGELSETDDGSTTPIQYSEHAPCPVTVSQTAEIHSQSLQSYDETDHAIMTAGLHQTVGDTSLVTAGKTASYTVPSTWLAQNHGQDGMCVSVGSPSHSGEHGVSCPPDEVHNKVVVSDGGLVLHNEPMSHPQVYRVDLSSQEHSCEMEVDLALQGGLAQPTDPVGEQSRDRAASIESTDSFMEVGILSQINHAQRLLASPSPTDQSKPSPVPSPVISLVADSSLRAAFNAFPAHPSETALTSDPLAVGCSPDRMNSSSHPNHTSVIKQVSHLDKPVSHKTEPPVLPSSEASFLAEERNASPARVPVNEGDLPLDMSVVKEEEDSPEQSGQDVRQSMTQATTEQDQQTPTCDAEDAGSTSLSPPGSMQNEAAAVAAAAAAAAAKDAVHFLSATSSMQRLQHYTDRLLQQHQQQMNADLSMLHASFLSSADGEDSTKGRKRKMSELDDSRDGEFGKGGSGGSGGSPWPRKDMTQKEEYQFLERDPFMDFAEMTRLFPNMQQRTFYRWKRKIKDQFMFLEQQPSLTYAQFSHYFPQVREHVFEHWQDLLSQGHRFLGDTGKSGVTFGDSSGLSSNQLKTSGGEGGGGGGGLKDGESGTKTDSFISQYIFLQKNPNMDAEQFAKVFPEVPQQLFYMWKKQIFTDFLKLQANPKMTYQEFRKQASVTQDVFSLWKTHLMLMANPTHLMSTCSSLVTAPSSLTAAAPTLPPVSLLAARTGSKSIGDLAAWYASYAPLIGQMTLPFWSPLSIMSNPSLTASFSTLRDSSAEDQEADKEQSGEDFAPSQKLTNKEVSRSSSKDTSRPSSSDKAGEVEGSPSPQATEGGENEDGAVGHRGRRQSLKPEHYYYLLNPDTPYLVLTRVFPGVSAQRYGRWRRKVVSALAYLEREPNCSDNQFELYFPNVPDEILASWRERVRKGHSRLIIGSQDTGEDPSPQLPAPTQPPIPHLPQLTSPSPAQSGCHSRDSSVGGDTGSTGEEATSLARNGEGDKPGDERLRELVHETSSGPSPRKQYKSNREEYLFVQRYPSMDFPTFSTYFPNISVRTFYRWRREVRDAIKMLRSKPSLSLPEFLEEFPVVRERFPDLTEEVFGAWQGLVKAERQEAEGSSSTLQGSGEDTANSLLVLSNSSLLQQPIHAEGVTEEQEIAGHQQGVGASQHRSEVTHEENQGSAEDCSEPHSDPIESRGQQYRPEQVLVHMNPYLDYNEVHRTYPTVSLSTFYRWKREGLHVMDYMRKHPDAVYEDIVSAVPGVSFQAFSMWQKLVLTEKQLQSHTENKMETEPGGQYGTPPAAEQRGGTDTSARVNSQAGGESLLSSEKSDFGNRSSAEGAEESFSLMGNEGDENHAAKARRQTRDEFIEVMLNPAMDYSEFARRFGTVSQRTFYRWRAHIRDWRAAIRADPQLDYARFSRHARDVPEYVFNVWREWESRMENSTSHSAGDDAEGPQVESSESSGCHSQPAPTTASQGGVSGKTTEKGKTGSKQLKLMWMAFDYYRSHPTIDFKGLTALFPSVTMDMFQQWKKGVDVRMEYIRNIPSTNFEDFNRLFPDVQENIFNIFKASVLSEKSVEESYYLSHSQSAADTTSSSCLPALQTAYSPSSQAVFPQMTEVRTSAKQDKISDTMLRGAEGEPSHQVGYLSAKPIPTQSPHLQTSPAAGGGGEGLSVATPSVVSIKQESSPNTPLPSFTETVSNLSNLSRLNAMFQHRLPPSTPAAMSATCHLPSPFSRPLSPHLPHCHHHHHCQH
ncbi:uncharacterized protein LOC143275589 isoform X2 [Babylonia areolata]